MSFINIIKNLYTKPRFWNIFLFVLGVFFIGLLPSNAEAAALDNSRVIGDSIFYNKNSMNEGQIQSFLESKNSYLKGYRVPNDVLIGPAPGVNARGWSAAQVIYWSSQWSGLSPKVTLVTLQKEQSLIESPTLPLGQYSLDWAMGYAAYESGDWDSAFKGFAIQVAWGSNGLKNWSDWAISHDSRNQLGNTYWVGSTIPIDGQSIYLGNGPTASLYRYTPHIQTSFARIYQNWFGSLRSEGPYLIVNVSNPTGVYLVDGAVKRPVTSEMYGSWGLSRYPLDYISNESFNSYTNGLALTNFIDVLGHVYLVDGGVKRGVPSADMFNLWNFNWGSIISIEQPTALFLPEGKNVSLMAQAIGSPSVYLISLDKKIPIASYNILTYLGYPEKDVTFVSANILNSYTTQSVINAFIISDSQGKKYVFDNGRKRLIPDNYTYTVWGFNNVAAYSISDQAMSLMESGPNLSLIGQIKGNGDVFFLENGARRKIINDQTLINWGFNRNDIFYISLETGNTFLAGHNLTQLASHGGGVYFVAGNQFRPIFDADTFNIYALNWGLGWNDIKPVSDTVFASKAQGAVIYFPSLVTYSNGGSVYFMDGGKRAILDGATFNAWGLNWNQIFYTRNNAFLASYPNTHNLSVLASYGGGVYLIENSTKRPINSAQSFNNHATFDPRFRWDRVYPASTNLINSIPTGSVVY